MQRRRDERSALLVQGSGPTQPRRSHPSIAWAVVLSLMLPSSVAAQPSPPGNAANDKSEPQERPAASDEISEAPGEPADSESSSNGAKAQPPCPHGLLDDAEAKGQAGYTGISAELYVEAYRRCLSLEERTGPLGASVLAAAVEMYKRSVLVDPYQTEMLTRARRLLDGHLKLLEEHPNRTRPEDREELLRLREEIDLLSMGLRCRQSPELCSGPRRPPSRLALGLGISGGLVLLGGAALTSIGGTALHFDGIRAEDVGTLGKSLEASRRERYTSALKEQKNTHFVLLGVGLAAVVVGGAMLLVGWVHGRRKMQRGVVPGMLSG